MLHNALHFGHTDLKTHVHYLLTFFIKLFIFTTVALCIFQNKHIFTELKTIFLDAFIFGQRCVNSQNDKNVKTYKLHSSIIIELARVLWLL